MTPSDSPSTRPGPLPSPPAPQARGARAARGALGAALVAAAWLPAHRLLDPARAGPAGVATRAAGEAAWGVALWGTLLVAAAAVGLAVLLPGGALRARLRRAGDRLLRSSPARLAGLAAAAALVLALAAALLLFERIPTLYDAMVQLLHARHWAHGALLGPLPEPAAARLVQNGVVTPDGWSSVYPPGHTALLALGVRLHAPWVVGPALTALLVGTTVLAARRLLPGRPRTALLGGALTALSPFVLLLGAGYLSHVPAAAGAALALLCALRARDEDGAAGWAVAAGLCTGATVAIRPWTGLVLGSALPLAVWLGAARAGRGARWLGRRVALWGAGGLPVAAAFALYHARVFGHPLRLGYAAAFGPAHGLGLHRDPWGNLYGAREALAYTGFDLMTLGVRLFETPVPVVGLVGLWLLLARRVPAGTGVLLAWALAPVLANALYWHHGDHLGPRMLYEAAPAWCILAVLAVVELTRAGGRRSRAAAFFLWLALVAVPAGLLLQLPGRLAGAAWSADARARSTVPALPDPERAVVFLHGSWEGREAARLMAAGMRLDSVETALRRNDLCRVHRYARARSAGEALPPLALEPLPGSPSGLTSVEVAPGVRARIDPGAPVAPGCAREARADRLGTVELAPLAWQTAIPGLEAGGPLLFRDMGPAANRPLIEAFPGRSYWMWTGPGSDAVPYEEGARALWGETDPR